MKSKRHLHLILAIFFILMIFPMFAHASCNGILLNHDFESGTNNWKKYSNGNAKLTTFSPGLDGTDAAKFKINTPGSNVQIYQHGFELEPNTDYKLTFDAYSNTGHDMQVIVHKHTAPYTNYGITKRIGLTNYWKIYSTEFTTTGFSSISNDNRIRFWFAPYDAAGDEYFIDNVCLEIATDEPVCEDLDGDGYNEISCGGNDCNDNDFNINPGVEDSTCNGIDNNCDGEVDEGYIESSTSCGVGECMENTGQLICSNGVETDTCDAFAGASLEICDLLDNDCDGEIDEGCSSPVCGNDIIESGEVCDGNSQSCVTSSGYIGTQQCNSFCDGFESCVSSEFCGDSICNGDETIETCSSDCVYVTEIPFQEISVDNYFSNSHCKAMGDIDGDGFIDLIVGGAYASGGVVWYKYVNNDTWERFQISGIVGGNGFTTSADVGDIDNDGDLDVIIPTGVHKGTHVWWFENPGPTGNPSIDSWVLHDVGAADSHDIQVGDIDLDGKLDIVVQNGPLTLFHQESPDQWTKVVVETNAREGTALGDLDNDGDLDIAIGGVWYETPSNPVSEAFIMHTYDSGISKTNQWAVHIDDINQDGRNDILLSPSDVVGNKELRLYLAPIDTKNGDWTMIIAYQNVDGMMHGIESGDVDLDGDIDIVTAEMEQTTNKKVVVLRNNGDSMSFEEQVVSTIGSHWIHLDDIDNDGDLDLFGVNHGNNEGDVNVMVWKNLLLNQSLSLDKWQRHVIDPVKPWRAVFINSEDINGDGLKDIVSGGWWYENPGNISNNWIRRDIGSPLNNMAVLYDFDFDGDIDILGTEGEGSESNDNFVWARNNGTGAFTILDNIENGDGDFLQGVIVKGNEIYLSWHQAGKGIQKLKVPINPSIETWDYSVISTTSQDEDLSLGDIQGDGDFDLLLGTKWLENQGGWWNSNWNYRAPINVVGTGYIDVNINFTSLGLSNLNIDSIRIIDNQNNEIAYQFEQGNGFNAQDNAYGNIVFKGQPSQYYVYFDSTFKPTPSYDNLISVSSVDDETQDSFRILTPSSTYYYQKSAGGFSSIVDSLGNDWINYNPTLGSSGSYRGIPNLVYPEGILHPGSTDSSSQLIYQGPIRTVIKTISNDDKWEATWKIYSEYAEMSVDKKDHDYWFLYEGTPGGEFDSNDYLVKSDNTQNLITENWTLDISGNEWVYFVDPADNKSLFLANLNNDILTDSYRPMESAMTVFGFGRSGLSSLMNIVPGRFAIGLIDNTSYNQVKNIIDPLYTSRTGSVGNIESQVSDTWTVHTLNNATGLPDRNELIDIDGDGRLDAVVGYEAISTIGKLAWYKQPVLATSTWVENIIANIIGPMSIDAGDMDNDGDIDIVAGEHNMIDPASARLFVYEKQGSGFIEQLVYTGDEHHDGAQLVDIDNDGDLDIISIGWSHNRVVLYENKAKDPVVVVCEDLDEDGYNEISCGGNDCNDNDFNINPGVEDSICNGIDNNCDGEVDEGYVVIPTTCGLEICQSYGLLECIAGVQTDTCVPGEPAEFEICGNDIDDNCNGEIDEECSFGSVYNVSLSEGWNTFSMLPKPVLENVSELEGNYSVGNVLSSIDGLYEMVYYYDNEWLTYSPGNSNNTLLYMNNENNRLYWIKMITSGDLVI